MMSGVIAIASANFSDFYRDCAKVRGLSPGAVECMAGDDKRMRGRNHRRPLQGWRTAALTLGAGVFAGAMLTPSTASAQRIENQTAVFAALDKVTARISRLETPLGKQETFAALKVTARVCYSRPPTEPPKTSAFVEVDEVALDGSQKRIFSGWMFAESPGLNALEHAVFDLWLTDCANPVTRGAASQRGGQQPPGQAAQQQGGEEPLSGRRRVRR